MAKIHINNPKQVINGGAKKYYFKVKGLGGPKGDKGDKGDTGQTGPQGPQGNAATVSVGSTTTLPVGYDAIVENVGTLYNAVLNFGIPQGPRGPQGATGATGAKGDKGDQGNPGPQGEKGTNATVYVGTTSTLNPGSQATVYNSGTDSNAVLNFGIPKGEKGDTGPMPTIAQTTGQAIDQVMSQKATTDALNTKQDTISSSNKLSADLVTDTSTTNKFVTAEDKTTWNGKQDALTAGTGIDITSGIISTPAIVPEVVTELPTTGAEGKLYLTPKAHTTQTATGNPITATVAEDAGKIESFQLDGDTFQQTYSGKNLLNYNTIGQTTLNGVTLSLADDGTITLDGTCSADNTRFGFDNLSIALDGTYTLSFEVISGTIENATDTTEIRLFKSGYYGGLRVDLANTSASSTLSVSGDYVLNDIRIDNGVVLTNYKIKIQLEKSATATSFEPFVGGQLSPNPDYPQPIQTVTGEQAVEIAGKNIYDPALATASGANNQNIRFRTPLKPSTQYTFNATDSRQYAAVYLYDSDGVLTRSIGNLQSSHTITFTTSSSEVSGAFDFYARPNVDVPTYDFTGVQLELGSTATTYEPYQGQSYPISLGNIELCKLGAYQDYIYKDGDSWKLHKETHSVTLTGVEQWQYSNVGSSAAFFQLSDSNWEEAFGSGTLAPTPGTNVSVDPSFFKSTKFVGISAMDDNMKIYQGIGKKGSWFRISLLNTWNVSTVEQLQTWLSNNNVPVTYVLATATDTVITDTTLIAQLEAIRTAMLQNGANTITNSATAPNLAGDMEVGYYGYNPTNRYDKWLWLDINNEYEQIGS